MRGTGGERRRCRSTSFSLKIRVYRSPSRAICSFRIFSSQSPIPCTKANVQIIYQRINSDNRTPRHINQTLTKGFLESFRNPNCSI